MNVIKIEDGAIKYEYSNQFNIRVVNFRTNTAEGMGQGIEFYLR